MNPAAMTERLIDAAIDYERSDSLHRDNARKELNDARAEIEAALSPAEAEALRAGVDALSPSDLQLLMKLKDDNRHDGARPVIGGNVEAWNQARRLSDLGYIAIEQVARGGRLHITRSGVAAFRAALLFSAPAQELADAPDIPKLTNGVDPCWDSPPGRWDEGDHSAEPYPEAPAQEDVDPYAAMKRSGDRGKHRHANLLSDFDQSKRMLLACIEDRETRENVAEMLMLAEQRGGNAVATVENQGPGPVDVRFTEACGYGVDLPHGTKLYTRPFPLSDSKAKLSDGEGS